VVSYAVLVVAPNLRFEPQQFYFFRAGCVLNGPHCPSSVRRYLSTACTFDYSQASTLLVDFNGEQQAGPENLDDAADSRLPPTMNDRLNLIPPLPLPAVTGRYRLPAAVRVTVTSRHRVLCKHAVYHHYQPLPALGCQRLRAAWQPGRLSRRLPPRHDDHCALCGQVGSPQAPQVLRVIPANMI
jgi:hypothetical protein